MERPKDLVDRILMDVNEEDRKSFKKLRSMRSFVGRVRSSQEGYIKCASTMEKLENANLEKAKTALGENLLLKDSGLVAGKRQVVFATEKDVELLASCSTLYLDGTFKPTPKLFNQVWTVAGEYKHHFVPCVFSLLTNKDTESYIFVLNELKIRGVNPSKVHGDFEAGEIAAINEVWPNAEIICCQFHFAQTVLRKAIKFGFNKNWYKTDLELQLILGRFTVLGFSVDEHNLEQNFIDCCNALNAFTGPEFMPTRNFIAYFKRTWVGGEIDGKMKRPKYSFATWHYYKIAEEMEARTNNALEAFNRSLQEKIGLNRKSINNFVEALKQQQTSNRQTVVDADRSHYRADTQDLKVRDVCRQVDWFADDKLTYLDSLVSILRPDRFV